MALGDAALLCVVALLTDSLPLAHRPALAACLLAAWMPLAFAKGDWRRRPSAGDDGGDWAAADWALGFPLTRTVEEVTTTWMGFAPLAALLYVASGAAERAAFDAAASGYVPWGAGASLLGDADAAAPGGAAHPHPPLAEAVVAVFLSALCFRVLWMWWVPMTRE